ncbi:MAG: oligoendopeptidase F [Lachnospiraceae bacterium]|nr:oligoendopeptidase F [Lachnospiraceae bacterium]
MSKKSALPKREEIAREYKWAIEDMYKDETAWKADYELAETMSTEFAEKFQGKICDCAENLLATLEYSSKLNNIIEKLYVYANQKLHENTADTKSQAMAGKAQTLAVKSESAAAFVEPEILACEPVLLKQFIDSEILKDYRHMLSDLDRSREHILTAEMEELLSEIGEFAGAAEDIFSMFNNADIKFPAIKDENGEDITITHGRYSMLMESEDRRVRKEAFEGLYHTYDKYKNTLAAIYNASVKKDAFYAKTRKYGSTLEAKLDANYIPVSVYENLIEAVHESLPAFYRYVALRKKRLGVDELHMYDVYAPLVSEVDMKVDYDKAKKMVKEGLAPMGADYIKALEEGFNNKWIDVYENEGKRSGAYSWGAYGTHPYVLMNYNGTLNHVFTLAHEMGHALHSYYSDANQSYHNAGYSIFVAEVASTCNEALLIHYLLEKTTDKKEKAYLINYFLEQFKGTLFRQTMFAEFEKKTHELVEAGESLNVDMLNELYRGLNEQYFGPDMILDDEIDLEWARIPHFYTPFYVYQYATGFSAAIALSKRIRELGAEGVDDYMKFLTGGGSKYPIDLLKLAGVDMTSPQPVRDAIKVFEDLVAQLEELDV